MSKLQFAFLITLIGIIVQFFWCLMEENFYWVFGMTSLLTITTFVFGHLAYYVIKESYPPMTIGAGKLTRWIRMGFFVLAYVCIMWYFDWRLLKFMALIIIVAMMYMVGFSLAQRGETDED